MTGQSLMQALKSTGTGASKLALVQEVVKSNPNAGPESFLHALKDRLREHGKGTPYGDSYGEGLIQKAEQLLKGTYTPPTPPDTPATKALTHGDLREDLGSIVADLQRSIGATVRDAISTLGASAAQAEPIDPSHVRGLMAEAFKEAVAEPLGRLEQVLSRLELVATSGRAPIVGEKGERQKPPAGK